MADVTCIKCASGFVAKRSDAKYCTSCGYEARLDRQRRFEKNHMTSCLDCGGSIHRRFIRCKTCSNSSRDQTGEKNPFWKGGRSLRAGYATVLVDGRHRDEHRVVWEEANGPIPDGYVVHHMNGVKTDNRLENLLAVPRHQHHSEPHKVIEFYETKIRELEMQLATISKEV